MGSLTLWHRRSRRDDDTAGRDLDEGSRREPRREPQLPTHVLWCDESHGHPGPHHHFIGDVVLDVDNQTRLVLVAVECGPDETDPLPVLRLGIRAGAPITIVRPTWEQAARLVAPLRDTIRRFG
jgi:hypothetical protein